MGRRAFEPHQAVVVYVGKDGRDSTPIMSLQTGWLRSPRALVNVLEEKLVHAVIGSVRFQQDLADFRIGRGLVRQQCSPLIPGNYLRTLDS
jgi:hypothetical protein